MNNITNAVFLKITGEQAKTVKIPMLKELTQHIMITEVNDINEAMRECYGSKFRNGNKNIEFVGIVDEVKELQFKFLEESLKRECLPHNIFGVEIEPETPKDPTPEELRKQEEFSGKMTQLRHFMEENNISIDNIKEGFDLYSDEEWEE